jgi:putative acetyltransferase
MQIQIRSAAPSDLAAARAIHAAAFRRPETPDDEPVEVRVLDDLVADGDIIEPLTLVAELNGKPVGHVACSTGMIDDVEVAALGPIGVLPEHQGNGIGSALVRAALDAADGLGYPVMILLGSTVFYGRFGFVPASGLGIESPDPAWGDYFQAHPLTDYQPELRGRFRYAPAFDGL